MKKTIFDTIIRTFSNHYGDYGLIEDWDLPSWERLDEYERPVSVLEAIVGCGGYAVTPDQINHYFSKHYCDLPTQAKWEEWISDFDKLNLLIFNRGKNHKTIESYSLSAEVDTIMSILSKLKEGE